MLSALLYVALLCFSSCHSLYAIELYANILLQEVYNVANCDSFPYYTVFFWLILFYSPSLPPLHPTLERCIYFYSQSLTFQNLAIAQSGVGPVGFNNANWAIFNQNTECGQNMACDGIPPYHLPLLSPISPLPPLSLLTDHHQATTAQ